jgi:outer membrane protein assembly factor BamB
MSALELLDRLTENGLLSSKVAGKIRQQIEVAPKEVTAKSLAKMLVKKGQLTPTQAKLALESLPPSKPPRYDDDDLGLRDDDMLADDREVVEPVEAELLDSQTAEPVALVDPFSSEATTDRRDASWDGVDDHGDSDTEHDPMLDELQEESTGRTIATRKRGLAGLLASVRPGGRRKMSANRWDSPLMLVGGGSLLVMVIVGIALYFFLSRGTGDEAFSAALESYRQGAYSQAMGQFESFIGGFPDHPKVSSAKVHIGMAKIWGTVEQKRWEESLETVRTELPKIVSEEAFNEARPELASLLPEIMEGFADTALSAQEIAGAEQYLGLANQTLEEVNNAAYLPTSVRRGQQPRIEQILAKLESVKRRISRDQELEKTIASIRDAAAQRQIAAAYDLRKALLKAYPSLETDERLQTAVREVASIERDAVSPLTEPPQPVTADRPVASQFRVVLAQRRGQAVPALGEEVLFVVAEGSAYGLRAADGTVLWRRFLGYDALTPPLDLKPAGSSDVILVDTAHRELLRLDHLTGNLVWRLPCPGPLTVPRLIGGRIFVACNLDDQGLVFAVDPADGRVTGGAQLPLPVETSPAVDVDRQVVIQPAARSTVYQFSLQDWSCLGVTYLGHAPSTIVVPPEIVAGAVLIAENPGVDFSLLHVLVDNSEQPGVLRSLDRPRRSEGQVVVPMVGFGRRVLFSTDRGKIVVLELDLNQPTPVRVSAEAVATVQPGTVSYPLLSEGRLWIGDNQLTFYELQTSRGQLARKWLNSKGDRFVSPLVLRGNVLLHVRRAAGKVGVQVAAIAAHGSAGNVGESETIWETTLAAPPAGEPFVDRAKQEINLVTGNGVLFTVDKQAIREGLDQQPAQELFDPQLGRLVVSVDLDETRKAFFANGSNAGDRFALYDGSAASNPLRVVTLDLAGQQLAAVPDALRGMLLVPTRSGAVNVIDPAKGTASAAPFLPDLGAGASMDWQRPFVLPSSDHAILADSRGSLYYVSLQSQPQPHLAAERQQQGDVGLIARPIVVGETILTIARGAQADILRRYRLADLQLDTQLDLPGRVIWGPHQIGDLGLVMTDQNRLIGFNQQGVQFDVEGPPSPLVGNAAHVDQSLVLASSSGTVLQLAIDSGREIARAELGEPLGTGPVPFAANRFIVSAGDGTLHIVSLEPR